MKKLILTSLVLFVSLNSLAFEVSDAVTLGSIADAGTINILTRVTFNQHVAVPFRQGNINTVWFQEGKQFSHERGINKAMDFCQLQIQNHSSIPSGNKNVSLSMRGVVINSGAIRAIKSVQVDDFLTTNLRTINFDFVDNNLNALKKLSCSTKGTNLTVSDLWRITDNVITLDQIDLEK